MLIAGLKKAALPSKLYSQSPLRLPSRSSSVSWFSPCAAFYVYTVTYFMPTLNSPIYISTEFQKCGSILQVSNPG